MADEQAPLEPQPLSAPDLASFHPFTVRRVLGAGGFATEVSSQGATLLEVYAGWAMQGNIAWNGPGEMAEIVMDSWDLAEMMVAEGKKRMGK